MKKGGGLEGQHMTIDRTLEDDGFILVGHISIQPPSTFVVKFDVRKDTEWWPAVIYAFRIGNEVVRMGKSENTLRTRMKQWGKDVSNGLAGKYLKGATTEPEAEEWRKRLNSEQGELWVLRVCIPDAELLEQREKELIKAYDPPLCWDSPSNRKRRRKR